MAKKKKKAPSPGGAQKRKSTPAPKQAAAKQGKAKKKATQSRTEFTVKDYVVINLIFWAFCLLLYFVVWMITGENVGLSFLFGVLAGGFTLMSIFDYLYDYFEAKKGGKTQTQS